MRLHDQAGASTCKDLDDLDDNIDIQCMQLSELFLVRVPLINFKSESPLIYLFKKNLGHFWLYII